MFTVIYIDLNLDWKRREDIEIIKKFEEELNKINFRLIKPSEPTRKGY